MTVCLADDSAFELEDHLTPPRRPCADHATAKLKGVPVRASDNGTEDDTARGTMHTRRREQSAHS